MQRFTDQIFAHLRTITVGRIDKIDAKFGHPAQSTVERNRSGGCVLRAWTNYVKDADMTQALQLRASGPMNWAGQFFALNRRGYSNYAYLLDGSGIWSKPPSAEFYKRRAAIAAMALWYAKHHPGIDYRMAAIIGVGVNDTYPTITVTALDIATYIQKRDPSIPWNVCVTAGAYMETWVDYSRQGFDALAASEILSQGVSNGLKGKVE